MRFFKVSENGEHEQLFSIDYWTCSFGWNDGDLTNSCSLLDQRGGETLGLSITAAALVSLAALMEIIGSCISRLPSGSRGHAVFKGISLGFSIPAVPLGFGAVGAWSNAYAPIESLLNDLKDEYPGETSIYDGPSWVLCIVASSCLAFGLFVRIISCRGCCSLGRHTDIERTGLIVNGDADNQGRALRHALWIGGRLNRVQVGPTPIPPPPAPYAAPQYGQPPAEFVQPYGQPPMQPYGQPPMQLYGQPPQAVPAQVAQPLPPPYRPPPPYQPPAYDPGMKSGGSSASSAAAEVVVVCHFQGSEVAVVMRLPTTVESCKLRLQQLVVRRECELVVQCLDANWQLVLVHDDRQLNELLRQPQPRLFVSLPKTV
eukprot:TRINITY_DN1169_c0_g1_i4.p1 TRINITY_DN1169_c0_g1~~TRINITY_DN1169_c0_g1_i4.p1  ORF type:complete len:434 (-),score=77.75 TRINITY_DN1169_c0_g1_i4:30-1145(-)